MYVGSVQVRKLVEDITIQVSPLYNMITWYALYTFYVKRLEAFEDHDMGSSLKVVIMASFSNLHFLPLTHPI